MPNERHWCVHFKSVTCLKRLHGGISRTLKKPQNIFICAYLLKVSCGSCKVHFLIKYSQESLWDTVWLCECVCSGFHVHASLDLKSGSLVFREGSIWLLPVSPAVAFQQFSGVNVCSITAHPLFSAISSQKDQGERNKRMTCKIISVSSVTLLRPLWLDLRWMLLSSSPAYRFPSLTYIRVPAFLYIYIFLNLLSLFAHLHLPVHCYSLLPAAPSLVHCIMFMCCAFHFFISVIRYRLPFPTHSTWPCHDCTSTFLEDCVSLHFTAILSPLCFFKNQLPIK